MKAETGFAVSGSRNFSPGEIREQCSTLFAQNYRA